MEDTFDVATPMNDWPALPPALAANANRAELSYRKRALRMLQAQFATQMRAIQNLQRLTSPFADIPVTHG